MLLRLLIFKQTCEGLLRRLAPVLLLSVAGCGFAPVYGDRAAVNADARLATVKVDQIDDHLGVILTDHLRDSFNGDGAEVPPEYRLTVTLNETQNGSATRADGTAAWIDIVIKADWTLRRLKDDRIVSSGSSSALAGYGVLNDNYANLSSQYADELRDLDQLQGDITTRLALYLKGGGQPS